MNILIVKLSSLGDVVQTMPVVADILAVYPDAKIDWVVEEAFAPLLARLAGVQRVIPIALRRWKKTWLLKQTRQERAAAARLVPIVALASHVDFVSAYVGFETSMIAHLT